MKLEKKTKEIFVERIGRNVQRPRGTALVSGMLETMERTDQFAFDTLHNFDCFEKIIAYSPSSSFAKKRLLGRSARYSGLLDVLDFAEGSPEDLISADGPLKDVNSWLAFETNPLSVVANAKAAKDAGVKHFAMVVVGSADYSAAEEILKDSEVIYTFITLGEIDDQGKEGTPFLINYNFTDASELGKVTRDDAVRVAVESFVIPGASNVNFGIMPAGNSGKVYIKEIIREKGGSRRDEIAHLIDGGEDVMSKYLEKMEKLEAEYKEAKRLRAEERAKTVDNRPMEVRVAERRERGLIYFAEGRCITNYERQLNCEGRDITGYIEDKQEYLDKYLNTTIDQMRPIVEYDTFNEVMYKEDKGLRQFYLDYEWEQTLKEVAWEEGDDGELTKSNGDGEDEPDVSEGDPGEKVKRNIPLYTDDDRMPGVYLPMDVEFNSKQSDEWNERMSGFKKDGTPSDMPEWVESKEKDE